MLDQPNPDVGESILEQFFLRVYDAEARTPGVEAQEVANRTRLAALDGYLALTGRNREEFLSELEAREVSV